VSGLVLVFKGQTLTQLLKDFFDHPAVVYLTGIILIFLSSIYLLQYNIWEGTRETIVTIFVWLVGIKGLMYIFFPEMLNKWTERKFRGPLVVYGIVAIIIGLYLFFLK
jgi:hypothetical protein